MTPHPEGGGMTGARGGVTANAVESDYEIMKSLPDDIRVALNHLIMARDQFILHSRTEDFDAYQAADRAVHVLIAKESRRLDFLDAKGFEWFHGTKRRLTFFDQHNRLMNRGVEATSLRDAIDVARTSSHPAELGVTRGA